MSSTPGNEAVVARIDELERELISLRTFFAPAADADTPDPGGASADRSSPQREEQELLLCRAGQAHIAVPLTEVREVVPVARLLPLPGAAQGVLGTLDLRGTPVVVHDMGQHLNGQPTTLTRTNLVLIARSQDGPIGLKVTDALDVIRATVSSVKGTRGAEQNSDIVRGVSIHEGTQVMVLDVRAIATRSVSESPSS